MVRRVFAAAAMLSLVAALGFSAASQTHGMGRVAGKVTDENGKPIEGVTVRGTIAAGGTPVTAKSNSKGDWVLAGIAPGTWNIDFEKAGWEPRNISVPVVELTTIPPIQVKLKPAAVARADPNVEIKAELEKAATLLNARKYADARAIYEALLAKYPDVHQLHPMLARTYYGEKNLDKAIEHLRVAVDKMPDNIEAKLLLGNTLVEAGRTDEGKQVLSAIDSSKITDPTVLLNVGITLINQGKAADALTYFDQVVTRFPAHADGYYYRGITHLQLQKNAEAKADLEKFVGLASPDAPELPMAKKILEQLK
ncbi:MAG TPA: tetratricopeptide repeat protein [Vicinamibacterales bacterium]|jgi:Flp pilus assembly protein TadD|nr:tetratricopeptide repeat protein [Vicinamibacterales bacterium]